MVLARVAPADPQRHTVDLLLPLAARRGDQQPRYRRRAERRPTAGAETRAGFVDPPTAAAGHPIGDWRRRDNRRDVWCGVWRWPSYSCGALGVELCHRHGWRGGRDGRRNHAGGWIDVWRIEATQQRLLELSGGLEARGLVGGHRLDNHALGLLIDREVELADAAGRR